MIRIVSARHLKLSFADEQPVRRTRRVRADAAVPTLARPDRALLLVERPRHRLAVRLGCRRLPRHGRVRDCLLLLRSGPRSVDLALDRFGLDGLLQILRVLNRDLAPEVAFVQNAGRRPSSDLSERGKARRRVSAWRGTGAGPQQRGANLPRRHRACGHRAMRLDGLHRCHPASTSGHVQRRFPFGGHHHTKTFRLGNGLREAGAARSPGMRREGTAAFGHPWALEGCLASRVLLAPWTVARAAGFALAATRGPSHVTHARARSADAAAARHKNCKHSDD